MADIIIMHSEKKELSDGSRDVMILACRKMRQETYTTTLCSRGYKEVVLTLLQIVYAHVKQDRQCTLHMQLMKLLYQTYFSQYTE